jgi:hypothetical protein
MSQRGRGSGPHDDDPDSEDAGGDYASSDSSLFSAPRPITPYDPYRPSSGDTVRRPTRNVAAESFDAPGRPASRYGQDDPFLPDDDPLNAEAWQLELDEAEDFDADLDAPRPNVEREPPAPRRPRRPPSASARASASSTRGRAAETGTGIRRTARRGSAGAASMRERIPSVSIGMPQAFASSSLAADPTALLLLGSSLISLLFMALLLGVRLGGVPSPAVLHLDAAGNPDRWGAPSVLWRLPLMAFFITLMFGVIAWFLHPIDRFAARFALGAAIVAQLVTWVAVIQHLFMA